MRFQPLPLKCMLEREGQFFSRWSMFLLKERVEVMRHALSFINLHMDVLERTRIFHAVAAVPAQDRADVMRQARQQINPQMREFQIREILNRAVMEIREARRLEARLAQLRAALEAERQRAAQEERAREQERARRRAEDEE